MPVIEVCPRCGSDEPLQALSRYDNKTMVCSSCGTNEAFWQWQHQDQSVPPLGVPLY